MKILYFFLSILIFEYIASVLIGGQEADIIYMFNFWRGIFALLMGIIFYLCFRIMNTSYEELGRSELILLGAMSISVAVEILQFLAMTWFSWLSFIVDFINTVFVDVVPGMWFTRFHGLAYEPSWLASQLTLIMLPLTLSRIVAKESLGLLNIGLFRVRLEWLFFLVSLLGIILSGSRTALFSTIIILLASALSGSNGVKKTLINFSVFGIILVLIISSSISNKYVGDTFFAILKNLNDPYELLMSVSAAPRISAWVSAWNIFLQHPIFGVGLGNSGIYYAYFVPEWALAYPEVQGWLSENGIINPKNMLLKLAAETGMVGLIIFTVFVLSHFKGKDNGMRYKILRNTGIIALIFNYFSLDTFALPTEWFLLGFIIVVGNLKSPSIATLKEMKELK